MALNSPGIGSGIDVKSLVNQLVSAAAEGPSIRFNQQEALLQAKISGLGTLKSSLSDFQASLANLNNLTTYSKKTATNSQSELFNVTATSEAANGSYSVEVKTLAQSQKLASKAFADTTTSIGTGTLTFRFGTYDSGLNTFTVNPDKAGKSVVISSDDSLQGIRDAVNDANIGVTATIINDGSGDRLVFTSNDTGAENSLEVTVSGDSIGTDIDDTGLSQLAYDPTASGVGTGKNLSENVTATDATLEIDGISISSDTNTIKDAIQGVTLELTRAEIGTKASVIISDDRSNITSAVNKFVEAYNKMVETVNQLSSYNQETGEAGILLGDATLRGVTSQIRRVLSSPVDGLSGQYTALVNLGLRTQEGGKLKLDTTKLNDALDADFENVSRIFAAAGNASDSQIAVSGFSENTEIGSYAVNISQLATQGNYAGAAVSSFPVTIDADNDTFVIEVDGTTSSTITLTAGSYTAAELATELQSQINSDSALESAGKTVNVAYDTDHFVISSSSYGSESTVNIISVDTNTESELGLSTTLGTSTDGLDVAGTIGGYSATGNGQVLTSNNSELSITVSGGSLGDRGVIDFSRGVADSLNNLISGLLSSDGVFSSRTTNINNRIDDINDQREVLTRRLQALEQRYLAQFNAMDSLVGQLQSTSNFLLQQLSNTPFAQQ